MELTQAFREAVQNRDILSVRIMMKDSLLREPDFKEFKAMEEAAKDIPDLYEPHDGTEMNFNESAWNDAYLDELMADVLYNFSHERLAHLKKVITKLHPYTRQERFRDELKGDSARIGGILGAAAGFGAVQALTASALAATVIGLPAGAAAGAVLSAAASAALKESQQKGEK